MAKRGIGKDVAHARTPKEAEEVAAAIEELNTSVGDRCGSRKFCVAKRVGTGWRMVGDGPHDPYQCVVMAASAAEAGGTVFGVFVVRDDEHATGPEIVFGRPGAVARAWVERIAPSASATLAFAMDASVRLNAARIEAQAVALSRAENGTEH